MKTTTQPSSEAFLRPQKSSLCLEGHGTTPRSTRSTADANGLSLEWPLVIFVLGVPIAMLVSLFWVPVYKQTIQFMFIYGIIRGLCITAGYHRLWAHKAYSANSCLKLVFAVIGAGAGQGAIKTWCRDHRAHHRYVDTEQDPYSVQKGFFHAHIGWIIFKKDRSPSSTEATGRVDISDLKSDPIVEWQRRYYWQLLLLMGYILPMAVCGLGWGDYLGGFVLAGCLGTSGVQQGTFCINSVAHWIGSQPYQTTKSPRDNFFAAFLTFGEGYHNFHHEFPIDYRNGIRWYDYDPTKWLIWLCGQFGFASNLRRFPYNEIQKGRIQGKQEKLRKESEMIDWGLPLAKLPTMKWEEYQEQSRTGCNLIFISGFVYEVSDFVTTHPGGALMLTGAIGKDATKMFEGGVYRHSNAARNLLDTMRIAVITA